MGRKSIIDQALAERLEQACIQFGNRHAAARAIGVSDDAVYRYFQRKRALGSDSLSFQQKVRNAIPRHQIEYITGGYVYLFKADCYYKIGKTINVVRRANELSLPFEVEIVHTILVSDMNYAEMYLHHMFAKKRIRGEWFRLSHNDVEYICSLQRLEP